MTGKVSLHGIMGRIDEDKKPLKHRGKRDATDCESKLESVRFFSSDGADGSDGFDVGNAGRCRRKKIIGHRLSGLRGENK
jgi:hypothetical protein